MRQWMLFVAGLVLITAGSVLASRIQTADGVRIEDIRFQGTGGQTMSALLYVPSNATAATPAPGVLAIHGYINSREMQDGFAIEFARRGYVVLALDQTGHGFSAPPAFANGFGGPDGLSYLRSLPFVDRNNMGLEGHSLGGAAVLLAAKQYPDDYRAIILVGSTTSPPAVGTPSFPRNAAFVLGKYDEFTPVMWGNPGFVQPTATEQKLLAKDVATASKLKTIFGTAEAVHIGSTYGDIAGGTGRTLYLPVVTHPGEHLSTQAIADAADWFSKTLTGGTPRGAGDQIWYWKELGTLVAFGGFVLLLLGTFDLLLALPYFASLKSPHVAPQETRGNRWWLALAAAMVIPALAYFPLMILGSLIPPSSVFAQAITTQVVFWALGSALLALLLRLATRSGHASLAAPWLPAVAIAVATVAVGYLSLVAVDAVFHVDYRFWVVGLKLMSPWQIKAFLVYLLPFTLYFLLTFRALLSDLPVKGESWLTQYATAKTAMAGGIFLLVVADYVPLWTSNHLLLAFDPLHAIIALQFVVILAVVAWIAVFTYRRTNSHLPGALISALFVTWYVVAGTATMA